MTNLETLDGRHDASGGYKVDISRGERIGRVSSEWFSRPDDERYLSLSELYASVKGRAERSRTRTVESAAIRVEAHRDDPENLTLILPDADAPAAPTHWSFGQLASLVSAPAAYLRQLPAPLAGINLQYGLTSHRAEQIKTLETEDGRTELRTDSAKPKGKLSLSASVAFGQVCVMPHVSAFLERYPEIDLDLKFTDRNVDLVAEHVDLAIRLGPSVGVDVIAAKLRNTRYRVCASPDYIRKHGKPRHPRELANHRCVCFDLPDFRTHWLFRLDGGPIEEIDVTPRITVSGALALRDAALTGLGPALLADWLIGGDLSDGALIDLYPEYDVTATTFDTAAWLLYPSRTFLPRKTRVMIDFLRERLGST